MQRNYGGHVKETEGENEVYPGRLKRADVTKCIKVLKNECKRSFHAAILIFAKRQAGLGPFTD